MTKDKEIETLRKDAMRYRKLRDLALVRGTLEAAIAIGQFDFIRDADRFDDSVDALDETGFGT